MARNLVCSECGGNMKMGYVPDYADKMSLQTFWVEGRMEKGFLGFPKIKNRKQYDISAYRCERCGLLKFYAGPDHSS
jgi:hypothetical protein